MRLKIGLKRMGSNRLATLGFALACSLFCSGSFGETNRSRLLTQADFAAFTKKTFDEAQSRYNRNPHDTEAACQLARACFDLGDYATNGSQRAQIAEQGIAICRQLVARKPGLAPAHYYLGMNLGQLARTKTLGALKIVDEMEREFHLSRSLDELFDNAGSDRNLGLLYREAPSVGSIGSRTKARHHLQRAVELAPKFPDNRLNLMEAYLKWSDRNGLRREYKALLEIWPEARANLTGDIWAASWFDWEKRLNSIKKKVEETPRSFESPRQKD